MQFHAAAEPAGFPGFAEPAEPVEQRTEFPLRRSEFPFRWPKFAVGRSKFAVGWPAGPAELDSVATVVRHPVAALVGNPVTILRYSVAVVRHPIAFCRDTVSAEFAGPER